MLEFNLFLIDYWFYSVPLFLFVFLFFRSEMKKGGQRISPNDLTRIVNKENGMIIDLRKKELFEIGHITGSKNIPSADFDNNSSDLDKHKDKPIILICEMGRDSANIGEKLQKRDFKQTLILKGGMLTWVEESLPLVRN